MNPNFMFPRIDRNLLDYRELDYRQGKIIENDDADKMNIVFLDIDGVISPYSGEIDRHNLEGLSKYLAWKYHDDIYTRIRERDIGLAYYEWDLEALGKLKKFLNNIEAEVVIHSDWCWNTDLDYLKALFRLYSMDEYIYDKMQAGDKKENIKKYLELHKDIIENYVIFDDDASVQFDDHFVLTKKILTQKNIKDAYKIFDR